MIKQALFFIFLLLCVLYYFNAKGYITVTPQGWERASELMQDGRRTLKTAVKKAVEMSEEPAEPVQQPQPPEH